MDLKWTKLFSNLLISMPKSLTGSESPQVATIEKKNKSVRLAIIKYSSKVHSDMIKKENDVHKTLHSN